MLNYMGPNIGSGPVTNMLPPATPGTIPSGVPGIAQAGGPSLPPPSPIMRHGQSGPPPAALAAILNHPGAGGPPPGPPPPPQYATVTQENGTILLHIKNPDGSLGPVVKVLPPIKLPGQGAPGQK